MWLCWEVITYRKSMNDQRTPSQLYGKLIITAKGILNITFWRLSKVQWPLPIQNRNQTLSCFSSPSQSCDILWRPSWLPYSTYLYLDFHLFVFHDKAKRTQQGNLLVGVQTCEKYGEVVRMGWKAKAAAFLFPTASLRWSLLINVAHTHTLCILQRAIYYSIFRQEARNRLALLFIYHF